MINYINETCVQCDWSPRFFSHSWACRYQKWLIVWKTWLIIAEIQKR